ncbi:hypothetical protein [Lonsdalea quercina]|uniref:hypothetical protein n=1 Tax=Lonsdalea quercina TaxID=71657 RepID=UPI0039750644
MFPFNAWLQSHIDDYRATLRDATMEMYMAEVNLDNPNSDITHIRSYYLSGMNMVELSQRYGDDDSYLLALIKMHHRLIREINNPRRCHLCRLQSYHFGRQTLQLICNQFSQQGCWQKVTAFQADFAKRVAFMP